MNSLQDLTCAVISQHLMSSINSIVQSDEKKSQALEFVEQIKKIEIVEVSRKIWREFAKNYSASINLVQMTIVVKITNPLTQVYNLSNRHISDQTLACIPENAKCIDLEGCESLTNTQLKNLFARIKNLLYLNVANCPQISDEAFSSIDGSNHIEALHLEENQVGDHTFEILAASQGVRTSLTALTMSSLPLTDRGIELVSKLPQLKILELTSIRCTNKWVQLLSSTPLLEQLHLRACDNITNIGLASLLKLTRLSSLDLARCDGINGQGIVQLSHLTHLISLSLNDCEVESTFFIKALTPLKHLKRLELNGCKKLKTKAFKLLNTMEALTYLDLGDTRITPRNMARLASMKHLQNNLSVLGLDRNNFTDVDLTLFLTFKELKTLNLQSCRGIQEAQLQELRKQIPQVNILYYPPKSS